MLTTLFGTGIVTPRCTRTVRVPLHQCEYRVHFIDSAVLHQLLFFDCGMDHCSLSSPSAPTLASLCRLPSLVSSAADISVCVCVCMCFKGIRLAPFRSLHEYPTQDYNVYGDGDMTMEVAGPTITPWA
jgi:hypothetical protein